MRKKNSIHISWLFSFCCGLKLSSAFPVWSCCWTNWCCYLLFVVMLLLKICRYFIFRTCFFQACFLLSGWNSQSNFNFETSQAKKSYFGFCLHSIMVVSGSSYFLTSLLFLFLLVAGEVFLHLQGVFFPFYSYMDLSGTYCHKASTRPPCCTTPLEPTIYTLST